VNPRSGLRLLADACAVPVLVHTGALTGAMDPPGAATAEKGVNRMKVVRLAALAAVVAGVLTALAGTASATPEGKWDAQILGNVQIDPSDPTVATFRAQYVCTGDVGLWVSVKQTADRRPDPGLKDEGSSGISAGWLQSHRNPVTCDGVKHTDTFTVDKLEYGKGTLEPGQGYVQFCLTSADNFLSESRFAAVK